MNKRKTPWLAATLNLLFPGAGYIYVGTRLRFGVLLVAAGVIVLFAPPPQYLQDQSQEQMQQNLEQLANDPSIFAILVAYLLIAGAFAYDAWCDAKAYNQQAGSK